MQQQILLARTAASPGALLQPLSCCITVPEKESTSILISTSVRLTLIPFSFFPPSLTHYIPSNIHSFLFSSIPDLFKQSYFLLIPFLR